MSETPRISASAYSNTAPLVWSFLHGQNRGRAVLEMDDAPARSAQLLAGKRVDAALVPVIEYQRIADALLVPEVCVGARTRVRSVCLVTKGADLENVKTVALDISSRTSVALTKIIFREFLEIEPTYKISKPNPRAMLKDADCALIIGDPALAVDEKIYRKFDLAEIWRENTGFGFVFAMWMANAENAAVARTIDFSGARDDGLRHLDEIAADYETHISLPKNDLKTYLSENISYRIDASMQSGLELYFQLAHKHKLIENLKPLRFTGD